MNGGGWGGLLTSHAIKVMARRIWFPAQTHTYFVSYVTTRHRTYRAQEIEGEEQISGTRRHARHGCVPVRSTLGERRTPNAAGACRARLPRRTTEVLTGCRHRYVTSAAFGVALKRTCASFAVTSLAKKTESLSPSVAHHYTN